VRPRTLRSPQERNARSQAVQRVADQSLTLFLAFVLLQCFWRRNLKPPLRDCFTLIGLAAELYAALASSKRGGGQYIPLARGP